MTEPTDLPMGDQDVRDLARAIMDRLESTVLAGHVSGLNRARAEFEIRGTIGAWLEDEISVH